jgi:hypothetical protein
MRIAQASRVAIETAESTCPVDKTGDGAEKPIRCIVVGRAIGEQEEAS